MASGTIGFIGIGTMGRSMAANIQARGHDLVVHDVNREACADLEAGGAAWADTPAAVAAACGVLLMSLPGPAEAEAVVTGDDGVLAGADSGLAVFDLTTSSPAIVRKLQAACADRGVDFLDAPVSGGPEGAKSGKLAVLVGGEEAVFERHRAVLEAMADQPIYVGPIGAGTIAKLVHNLSGYIVQTALAETFTMGVKAGLAPDALWSAVRKCALGRARTFDRLGLQFLPGRFDPPDFSLRLALKDVGLAVELGRENEVPMALSEYTLAELQAAMERGWENQDSRIAMKLQEERAGVEVRVDRDRIAAILEDG